MSEVMCRVQVYQTSFPQWYFPKWLKNLTLQTRRVICIIVCNTFRNRLVGQKGHLLGPPLSLKSNMMSCFSENTKFVVKQTPVNTKYVKDYSVVGADFKKRVDMFSVRKTFSNNSNNGHQFRHFTVKSKMS